MIVSSNHTFVKQGSLNNILQIYTHCNWFRCFRCMTSCHMSVLTNELFFFVILFFCKGHEQTQLLYIYLSSFQLLQFTSLVLNCELCSSVAPFIIAPHMLIGINCLQNNCVLLSVTSVMASWGSVFFQYGLPPPCWKAAGNILCLTKPK